MDLAAFDWTIYWFMFPVSIVIATTAMLSGIGAAAMSAPIFMIIFPMLGPDYPFPSIAAAIGVALFTETFGFSSGFVGYFRKGLIDFKSALPFIAVGVPIGIVGAILLTSFKDFEEVLRGSYAVLMLVLAAELIRHHDPVAGTLPEETGAESAGAASVAGARPMRTITARDGTEYSFRAPRQGKGAIATGIGGFLTGLLGVGIVHPNLGAGGRGRLTGGALERGYLHGSRSHHRRPDRPPPARHCLAARHGTGHRLSVPGDRAFDGLHRHSQHVLLGFYVTSKASQATEPWA